MPAPSLALFKALADQSRLRILRVLELGTFSVGELVELLELGQSRVSRHLKILAEAGLVTVRRDGTWAWYTLRPKGDGGLADKVVAALAAEPDASPTDRERALAVLDRRERASRQYFEEVAPDWGAIRARQLGGLDYRDRLLATLGRARTAGDLGCGTGDLLLALAPRVGRAIGVDRSERMLAEAARRRDRAGAANVELRLGELEHLPLRDGELDGAVVDMVLHFVADPPAVLREVGRALAPGARLVLADFAAHRHEWMRDQLQHRWLGFEPRELETWARDAGFTGLATDSLKCPGSADAPDVLLLSGTRHV